MPISKRKPIPAHLRPQVAALQLAIKALTERRRRYYAAGHAAYMAGVRGLTFADDGERHYQAHSQAIRQLEDMIEVLLDPGLVTPAKSAGVTYQPELDIHEEVERRR